MPKETFSSSDIVGKTLFSLKSVPVKRLPKDNAEVVQTIPPGHLVGKVYSFMVAKPALGRSVMYWMFQDGEGRAYYTPHMEGLYDLSKLRAQGVLTVEEKKKKNETFIQSIQKVVIGGVTTWGAFKVISALISRSK